MKSKLLQCLSAFAIATLCLVAPARGQQAKSIPPGSKVFIAPMGGYETYLKAALESKKVPLQIVEDREKADFEITGHSDTQKASTAKKAIMWNWHSNEDASINITNLKSGEVVYGYEVHKQSSAHGKKSTAEACAKHLKEQIEKK